MYTIHTCAYNFNEKHTQFLLYDFVRQSVGLLMLLKVYFLQNPIETMKMVRQCVPCKLSPRYAIQNDILEFPERAYLAIHHRRPAFDTDIAALSLFADYFKRLHIITDIPCVKKVVCRVGILEILLETLRDAFFGSKSITCKSTHDKYQMLIDLVQEPRSALAVFPARDGPQFFGDSTYVFRDGLFAASMYTQIPIINIITLEPTLMRDHTLFLVHLWVPPRFSNRGSDDLSTPPGLTFEDFRGTHKKSYQAYTQRCEIEHKSKIKAVEEREVMCGINDATSVCPLNDSYDISIARNKKALELRNRGV